MLSQLNERASVRAVAFHYLRTSGCEFSTSANHAICVLRNTCMASVSLLLHRGPLAPRAERTALSAAALIAQRSRTQRVRHKSAHASSSVSRVPLSRPNQ